LTKIQNEKKYIEEERMKKYYHKEKRRKDTLDKLRTSLENAYLLKQD
jgi:hypothetical protein